jgi:hypothetical protein
MLHLALQRNVVIRLPCTTVFIIKYRFKKYCIESYKLCGNPPKKAVFPTIKRELKKRCTPPNQVI